MPNLVANRQTEVAPIFPNFFRMMPVAVIYTKELKKLLTVASQIVSNIRRFIELLLMMQFLVTLLLFGGSVCSQKTTPKPQQLNSSSCEVITWFGLSCDLVILHYSGSLPFAACFVYSKLLNSTRRTGKDPQNPKNTEWSIGKCFITDELFYKKHCKRKQ